MTWFGAVARENAVFMRLRYDHSPVCATSATIDDEEYVLFGTADGWVMRDRVGTTFDGEDITAFLRTVYWHFRTSQQRKRFRKVTLDCDSEGSATFYFKLDYDFAGPDQASTINFELSPAGGYFDIDYWNEFFWSSADTAQLEASIEGVGHHVSMMLWVTGDYEPFSINGAGWQFFRFGWCDDQPFFDFIASVSRFVPRTKAKAEDVNARFDEVTQGFDGVQAALDLKAPLASPTFTGVPRAPTAAVGTDSTQLATTEFVRDEIGVSATIGLPSTAGRSGPLFVEDDIVDWKDGASFLFRLPIFQANAAYTPASAMEMLPVETFATGLPTTGALSSGAYGASLLVVATATAAGNVASSADGETWVLRAMPSSAKWVVASDGTSFVAHVDGGTATAVSTDGVTWSSGARSRPQATRCPRCGLAACGWWFCRRPPTPPAPTARPGPHAVSPLP